MRFTSHTRRSITRVSRFSRGVTLIELMVVLAIAVILLGIAVPSFQSVTLGSKLRSYSNSLIASSRQARSEALKRNATVTMCISSDGASCGGGEATDWGAGWILITGGEVLRVQEAATTGFKVNGSVNTFDFSPSGLASGGATFTVCRETPAGSQLRTVTISATGRSYTEKGDADGCSAP